MTFLRSIPALLYPLVAPLSLLAQSVAPDAIELDAVEVSADKLRNFSLPLDAVPASGSRVGLSNRDLPASVSVVSQEVMQLRGLRTAVEAVEAAVGMTGGTQFGSIPGYTTRGFGGNSVTVMRDGIRQNTASQSSRTIDSFLLDRIEVLKGPAGLMFGEGAVGGAVNYLSKNPSATAGGDLLASIGSWDTYRIGLGWGGQLPVGGDDAPLTARFDYSHQESAGYVDRNAQRYDAFAGALGWQVTPAFKLTLFGTFLDDWNESYYGNPVVYDAVVNTTVAGAQPEVRAFNSSTDRMINPRIDPRARRTNYNILDNYAATENGFVRLRAEWQLRPDIELRNEAFVATQLLKWRNLETNVWNPVTQLVDRRSFLHIYRDDILTGNRLDVLHKQDLAGRPNRFTAGVSFENNDLIRGGTPVGYATTASAVSLLNPAETTGPGDPDRFLKSANVVVRTTAFYLEDALDLTPAVKLVAGLRYDHIDLTRDTFATATAPASRYVKRYEPITGRAGVVWSASDTLNLYASYSRVAEPVTQLVSFTSARDDSTLMTGRQYEVGAKGSLLQGRADFTLAVYDIEKNDLLASTLDPVTGERLSQQIGAQNSRGVELAVALSPGADWRIEVNAAYTDAWYGDYAENLGTGIIDRTGNAPSNIPEWVAALFVSKSFANGLSLSGGPRYVGDRFGNVNNSVVADAYITLDLGASYTWRNATFSLRGRNLLDEEFEPVAGTTMRRLGDPLSVEFSTHLKF